jgi:hypothetical protein
MKNTTLHSWQSARNSNRVRLDYKYRYTTKVDISILSKFKSMKLSPYKYLNVLSNFDFHSLV